MPLSRLEAAAHTVSDKTLTDVVFFSQVVLLVTQQKHNITFQIVLYTGGHLRVFQGAEVKSKLLPLLPLNLKRNTSHAVTCAMRQTHMSAHAHSGQAVYRWRTEYSPNILPIRSDTHLYLNQTLHESCNMIHGIPPCCGNKNLFSCSLLTQLKTHSSKARLTQTHHRKTFRNAMSPHCETNTLATTTTLASS